MQRLRILAPVLLAACIAGTAASARTGTEPRTIFDHAAGAWAVGKVVLGGPLLFREGRLRAFPSRITELAWAPVGKPRNIMFIYEMAADEVHAPFYTKDDTFFAPIELLPEHSFYKDNLPTTRRHRVAGGRRNVFRGDEMDEAKRVLMPFLEATRSTEKGRAKFSAQIAAVASVLDTPIARLREDGARYLASHPTLGRDFPESARAGIGRYLGSDAPVEERVELIDAFGSAKVTVVAPELEVVAKGNDAVAVAALRALDAMGKPTPAERIASMAASQDPVMKAYAAEKTTMAAASDPAALAKAAGLLDPSQPEAVRIGAAKGLGASGNQAAIEPLAREVERGDGASRAAAEALAAIGGEAAHARLKKALVEGRGEAAAAAVYGLRVVQGCADCGKVLAEQHEKHPDKGVKDLIAVVLELPLEHKH